MSIFGIRARLQDPDNGGGGGGGGGDGGDWRASFGAEAATALKDFAQPADFLKAFNDRSTELTTLKGQQPQFDFRKELVDPQALGADAEKATKFLSRFTDRNAFLKSVLEAQATLSQRDAHKPLAADAKPEEVKAWREAHGIPAEPKGYWEKLPQGLVIGKEDQPVFDAYGAIAHKHNVSPAVMHDFAKAYYDGMQAMQAEEATVDRADSLKATEQLRTLWGPDYGPNMSMLNNFLEGMPADVKDLFRDGTLADGTRFMNNPALVQFFTQVARQLNPAAHLIPPGGGGSMETLETELGKLKGWMADRNSEYWKGPNAERNQKRYRELLTAGVGQKKAS